MQTFFYIMWIKIKFSENDTENQYEYYSNKDMLPAYQSFPEFSSFQVTIIQIYSVQCYFNCFNNRGNMRDTRNAKERNIEEDYLTFLIS